MTVNEAREFVQAAGFEVTEEKRLGNDTGTQLRLSDGPIVAIYDNGTYYVRGKNTARVDAILISGGA